MSDIANKNFRYQQKCLNILQKSKIRMAHCNKEKIYEFQAFTCTNLLASSLQKPVRSEYKGKEKQ